MKEKCAKFCFIKLNANRFLQIHLGNMSLLSKLIFTHIVSCWSRSHEIVEKQNTKLSPETERTSHELPNDLRFRILGNEQKIVYLSFHWLNYSWTREFELVTRGFELRTSILELISRVFELVPRRFEHGTRGFKFVIHEFVLVTRKV